MLQECAENVEIRIAKHSRVIAGNGKIYRKFPKHAEIEPNHVKKLVQYLEIDTECANGLL